MEGERAQLGQETPERVELEHPALKAWARFEPQGARPAGVVALKERPHSSVYRILGIDSRGTTVIAKRSAPEGTGVEALLYERFLPRLELPLPRLLGTLDEAGGGGSWLFLEDAGDSLYDPSQSSHRAAASRWLGSMQLQAAGWEDLDVLPDCGAVRHLSHLRSARCRVRERIQVRLDSAQEGRALSKLIALLDDLEARWQRFEAVCAEAPRSFVHGDFVSKNLRVREAAQEIEVLPFDWHVGGCGPAAIDLGLSAVPGVLRPADVASYVNVVRDEVPCLQVELVGRLAELGRMFWLLACVDKDACRPREAWSPRRTGKLGWYADALERVSARLGTWGLR